MNRHPRIAGAAKVLGGLAVALLMQRPASAIEEIVVHGKRTDLEIDRAALRVDLTDYSQKLADSVRAALAATRGKTPPERVASTDSEPRG